MNLYQKIVRGELSKMKKSILSVMVALALSSTGVAIAAPIQNQASPTAIAATTKSGYGAGSQIKLSGAVNVRDLGGYRTKSGLKIKPNMLIRSAKLNTLTKHDQQVLTKQHHLAVDVDLRTPAEMKSAPDVKMSGVTYVADPVVSNKESQSNDKIFDKNGEQAMIDYYNYFVNSAQGRAAYKKLFHELLTVPKGKAVLWHCSAGKDRAGFGTALVLTALGVDRDTIYKDFLLSNKYRKQTNDAALAALKKKGASKTELISNYYGLIVEKQYLDEAYKVANKHYGSMNGFLHKGLGLTSSDINKLRAKYLEK
ncbi:aldo/keto reductase family protein [Lentilactobacillus buchneri ATCC 11577]|nr:aldo/keto reductase family protein [Lentilactobacillus buchneri ATCC 11577]MCT3396895.1 tyrosine-protein phosphatase [Lentilactobacillus hilgardii]